jgi:hypothetical protein
MTTGRTSNGAGGQVCLIGGVLFLVSWFVPVYAGQQLLGGFGAFTKQIGSNPNALAAGASGPDWLPGWGACRVAFELLVDGDTTGDQSWRQRLVGSSCLTNLVMLAGLGLLLMRQQALWVGVAMLGCVGINASWLYLSEQDPMQFYRAGYYLWLLSFALVGIGALLVAGRRR